MIEVEGLSKSYGELQAVDGLSLTVQPGEIVGLVGPNGAGKTTTLRCMTGIVPPDAGRVSIAGHQLLGDPAGAVRAKGELAFVPDEPRLFDYLTARDHLLVMARLYGVDDGPGRAAALLDELELEGRHDAFPGELSRGMKQKLMVAMALLHRPRALILDEPLTGLDPGAMRRMKDRLRRAAGEGVAVIVSSHMLQLVEEISQRIVIVNHGRKLLEGSLEQIRTQLPELDRDADLEEVFIRATEQATEQATE